MNKNNMKNSAFEIREEEENVCEACQKTFKSKTGLKRHEKVVHNGHRPHQCPCGKTFATNEQRVRHQNSKHTNEKPFQCQRGCSKRFASSSARIYHHKVVHDQEKFACQVPGCCAEYSSLLNLRRHFEKFHQPLIDYWNWMLWWNQHQAI